MPDDAGRPRPIRPLWTLQSDPTNETFYPPHAGHHHLIRAAAARGTRTTVAVLGASVESIPLADRIRWLGDEHAGEPGIAIVGDVDDHPIDFPGGPVLVCDNDPWAATVWCDGTSARVRPPCTRLWGRGGVPFEQDGWRDGEHRWEWLTVGCSRDV